MSTDAQGSPPREPPRDPPAYRATIHLLERLNDRYDEYNRHLDGEIIEECIRNGSVTWPDPTTARFHETFGGVRYRIVVDVRTDEAVTGHPVAIDATAAEASGRWSTTQIEDICEFLAAKYD